MPLLADTLIELEVVLCVDEMPYQRLAEVRESLLAAPGNARRDDYEYVRPGTWNVLLAFEPLTPGSRGSGRVRGFLLR
jgi:hypothetical protein